eukprot:2224564-Pleurochrysis_carterae.AAC.2
MALIRTSTYNCAMSSVALYDHGIALQNNNNQSQLPIPCAYIRSPRNRLHAPSVVTAARCVSAVASLAISNIAISNDIPKLIGTL